MKKQLLDACKRLKTLARLVTVRQAVQAGDDAIEAAGLNPWCINEGLATGDERLDLHFASVIDDAKETKTIKVVFSEPRRGEELVTVILNIEEGEDPVELAKQELKEESGGTHDHWRVDQYDITGQRCLTVYGEGAWD